MTPLQTAAQQALEAWDGGDTEWFKRAYTVMEALRAALAEQRLTDMEQKMERSIESLKTALAEPVQEPYDQTSLELCNVCGWKTLIPGDCCLNCERKHPRKPMNEFDALRLITETAGLLQSAGPVEGLTGIIRAVERAHGIGGDK